MHKNKEISLFLFVSFSFKNYICINSWKLKNTFHFNENMTHHERKINPCISFLEWKIDAPKSIIVFNRLIGSETTLIISTPYLSPCLFVWTRTYSYYENLQHFSQKQVYKNTTIILIFPKIRSMPFYGVNYLFNFILNM